MPPMVNLPMTPSEIYTALIPLDLLESHAAVYRVFRNHPVLAEWRAGLSIMTCGSPSAVLNVLLAYLLEVNKVTNGRSGLLFFLDAIESEYPQIIGDLKRRLEA